MSCKVHCMALTPYHHGAASDPALRGCLSAPHWRLAPSPCCTSVLTGPQTAIPPKAHPGDVARQPLAGDCIQIIALCLCIQALLQHGSGRLLHTGVRPVPGGDPATTGCMGRGGCCWRLSLHSPRVDQ